MRVLYALLAVLLLSAELGLAQPDGYEPLDGYGNNPNRPEEYVPNQVYHRALPANYADGIGAIDPTLPNVRELSNALFSIRSVTRLDHQLNDLHIGMGQLISHDINFNGEQFNGATPDETIGELIEIAVPTGDPYFDPYGFGNKTLPFRRLNIAPNTGVTTPRQFRNRVTPILDLSAVYSTNMTILNQLRYIEKSQYLRMGKTALGENVLPPNTMGVPMDNPTHRFADDNLFAAGDRRANQNPLLIALQTLFMLNHNYHAKRLTEEHEDWSEEKIFWEARRWNIAEYQAIVFNEYVAQILDGPLTPWEKYNPDLHLQVSVEFSGAAFRYAHSELNQAILFADEDRNIVDSYLFRDAYFNPTPVLFSGFSNLVRGLGIQIQQDADLAYIDDIRNMLFGPPGSHGHDLAAICVMRGRDMGMPLYNDVREKYGLPRFQTFDEITGNSHVRRTLEEVYGTPDNIELLVGGFAEEKNSTQSLSDTFRAIVQNEFIRLRDGDRWYFETQNAGFTEEEIANITITSITDIILRNTDINFMPCSGFFVGVPDCGEAPILEAIDNSTAVELLGGKYLLSWTFSEDGQSITFTVQVETGGWVGFGIADSSGSMVGADAMVGWVSGGVTVGDYIITDRFEGCPGVCLDTQEGGSDDFTDITGDESGGITTITWTRLLDTGDSEDHPIVDDGNPTQIVVAYGSSDSLSYHNSNKEAADINFFTGEASITALDVVDYEDIIDAHAWMMFIGWTVLFPIGIIMAKFCKFIFKTWWFRLHMIFQYLGVLVIIVALILAIEETASLGHVHMQSAHAIVGIIAVCLAIITPALGQFTSLLYRSSRESTPIFPDRTHFFLGYTSPLVAVTAIFLGLELRDVNWYWYFLAALWIFVITVGFWTTYIIWEAVCFVKQRKNRKLAKEIEAQEDDDDAQEKWSSGEDED